MVIPLGLAVWYVLRNRVDTVEFSNPEYESDVNVGYKQWPRCIGIVLLLIVMFALPLAVAQPMINSSSVESRTTVMVVLDVSTSMTATDVSPSRLEAAKAAIAQAIIDAPTQLNIGLVTLADHAKLVAAPSRDHTELLATLNKLKPEAGGTATGEGVFAANGTMDGFKSFGGDASTFTGTIFLVSDGAEEIKSGERPLTEAAKAATAAGYTLNTVVYGTPNGTLNGQPLMVDPDALKAAAVSTGGQAFTAGTGNELQSQLAKVQSQAGLVSSTQYLPLMIAVMAGVLLALLAIAFTLLFIVDRR